MDKKEKELYRKWREEAMARAVRQEKLGQQQRDRQRKEADEAFRASGGVYGERYQISGKTGGDAALARFEGE